MNPGTQADATTSEENAVRPDRGTGRIEAFSDSVFAFSLTLLVMSTEVPKTFVDLTFAMRGFVPFAACFAFLSWLWWEHHGFFKRYGAADSVTVALNTVLLFMLVFFVHPLKFLSGVVFASLLRMPTTVTKADGTVVPILRAADSPALMAIYAAGFLAVALVFWALYGRALHRRDALGLDDGAVYDAKTAQAAWLAMGGVALLSATIAVAAGPGGAAWAGFAYFLIGPAVASIHVIRGRRRPRGDAAPGA